MHTSWQRDLAQEIRIQRSCTSGPTGSWCRGLDSEIRARDPQTLEILRKWYYRILGDLDTDILRKWSSYTSLAQVLLQGFFWNDFRHLAQEIFIERSCTRDPTGPWCKDPDTEILRKGSAYRDLAQVVIQDPDAGVLTQRHAQETRIQRSCASSLTEKILTQTSGARDPHTPILDKCSYRILLRRFWHRHLAQEILIQWSSLAQVAQTLLIQTSRQTSCTRESGPTGSWCRHHDREILRKRSADRDLGQEIRANRSCASAPTGS